MRLNTLLVVGLMLAGFLLAGCTDGGDDNNNGTNDPDPDPGGDNNTTQPPPVTIQVALTGAYPATIAYDPATITVQSSQNVTIEFTNTDTNPVANHDWVLEGFEENASTDLVGNGDMTSVTFMAPAPGTYAFYCSVQGHRANGMEGDFVVE